MSPIYQTALTVACMLLTYYFGVSKGIKKGVAFVCSLLPEEELRKIVFKIDNS